MLYLHPHDSYMPCSVEYFMQNSELHAAEAREQVKLPATHACNSLNARVLQSLALQQLWVAAELSCWSQLC